MSITKRVCSSAASWSVQKASTRQQ